LVELIDLNGFGFLFKSDFNRGCTLGIAAETRFTPAGLELSSTRVLFMMTAALGRRDSYTYAHAQRVAAYCRRIGLRAGVSGEDLFNITLGGMLHDVGKLGLSDRIFSHKQAALSKEMIGEVRTHPVIGAQMLRHIQCSESISKAVLFHHERIDGSGYPFGLVGDEIPLEAKIVSVADCFDAITTDRPYQRRKSLPYAIEILQKISGICLDAELVSLLVEEIKCDGMEPVMPPSSVITPFLKSIQPALF
jgi:HD-GYP domain-containing protein (c-di-GMP phosphodiesterase class II)